MTENASFLTSSEAQRGAAMMMAARSAMCCRMCQ